MVYFTCLPVKYIMDTDIIRFFAYENDKIATKQEMILDQIKNIINPKNFNIAVLEENTNKVSGIIDINTIENTYRVIKKHKNATFQDIASTAKTISHMDLFYKALSWFKTNNENHVLLITGDNGGYAGRLFRSKIIEYEQILKKISEPESYWIWGGKDQ